MANVSLPRAEKPASASDSHSSHWHRMFTDLQRAEMQRDDYQIGARIFAILSIIFLIGLVLTSIAVLCS